jgi:hypothetical protein
MHDGEMFLKYLIDDMLNEIFKIKILRYRDIKVILVNYG